MSDERPVSIAEVQAVADGIRRLVLAMAIRNNGAYLAQACSAAEILATLYAHSMRLGVSTGEPSPTEFKRVPLPGTDSPWGGAYHGRIDNDCDRLIVSPAHYAGAVYAALALVGRLDEGALAGYARDGSLLELIGAEHSPGFEATTGSLGQGLSIAVGRALGRRLLRRGGRVWVLMSDGELQEGQVWEAIQAAAFHRLGNLIVLLDANGLQVDGPMDQVMRIESIADKLRAFNWSVEEVDGHNIQAIVNASELPTTQPRLVICRTQPLKGIDSLQTRGGDKTHYVRLRADEIATLRHEFAL